MANSMNTGDAVVDRRQHYHSFNSQKDLVNFFSAVLPKSLIRETIRDMKAVFITRGNLSDRENQLQFLRKCEWQLVRLSKKRLLKSRTVDQ